nr:hypothetical protein [Tanacetum cinerariifolium]
LGNGALAGNVADVEVVVLLRFALLYPELHIGQHLVEQLLVYGEAGLLGFEQEVGGVGRGPPVVVVAAGPVAEATVVELHAL